MSAVMQRLFQDTPNYASAAPSTVPQPSSPCLRPVSVAVAPHCISQAPQAGSLVAVGTVWQSSCCGGSEHED